MPVAASPQCETVKSMKGENETPGNAARSFEELHVYRRARELTNAVYTLTRARAFAKNYELADQIRRAAVSVVSNTAEGFERGASTEFIQFLYIAKGSCGEVRAQLQVALDRIRVANAAKGQLVIPNRFRKALHLQPGDKISFAVEGEKLVLQRDQPRCAGREVTTSLLKAG
jgi:four helix bundle protein